MKDNRQTNLDRTNLVLNGVAMLPHLPPRPRPEEIDRDFREHELLPSFDSLLITGGTGLVGRWLLTYLDTYNQFRSQSTKIFLATRRPTWALEHFKSLVSLDLNVVDVGHVEATVSRQTPDHIWHLAADTGVHSPTTVFNPIEADLEITLQICRGVKRGDYSPRILYTSSGAVYGRPTAPLSARRPQTPISESLSDSDLFYGYGKLLSESLLIATAKQFGIRINIARLFSLIGPLLPLDKHYAIGNFLHDASRRKPIRLKSRGDSIRSWLYLGDLARYLLLLASRSDSNIVDLGGEESMTLLDAADLIARMTGLTIEHARDVDNSSPGQSYIPNLEAIKSMFQLEGIRRLEESVALTLGWLQSIN